MKICLVRWKTQTVALVGLALPAPGKGRRGDRRETPLPRSVVESPCFVGCLFEARLVLTCRVWFVVQDESRIKATVMEVKPVDHKDYSQRLIMNIRKLAAQ